MKKTNAILLSGMLLLGIQASASTVVVFENSFDDYANGFTFDSTSTPFTSAGNFTRQVTEEPAIALFGDNTFRVAREHSVTTSVNGHLRTSVNFRLNNNNSTYTAQSWLYIGSRTPTSNSTQVSSVFGTYMWNADMDVMSHVTFATTRRNNNPVLQYSDGADVKIVDLDGSEGSFQFSADTWYGITMTVDELNHKYSFVVVDTNMNTLFSQDDLALLNDGQFNHYSIYTQGRSNDGFNNRVDGISISVIPEPSHVGLVIGGLVLVGVVIRHRFARR